MHPTHDEFTALDGTRRRPWQWAGGFLASVLIAGFAAAAATPQEADASARSAEPSAAARAVLQPAALPQNPTNPLAGRKWGVYLGRADQAYLPYTKSTPAQKRLLNKIMLRPRSQWYGHWVPNNQIAERIRAYIDNSTGGDKDVLVQIAVFRMVPWEHDACKRLPTDAEQASFKRWIRNFASAVGSSHAALILQPDGPFALCAPGHSKLPSHLIRYAARTLSALPNSSVYIDAGASDWPSGHPEIAARDILIPAGVQYARGFALNSTHYVSVASDINFGSRIVAELAKRGIPRKHFVIDTSKNGKPFTYPQARGNNFDNSPVCKNKTQNRCVTLGIPPTTAVTRSRWHLSADRSRQAAKNVDGYLWFGRPWLYMQANPFVKSRALALARTTPY
jgi:endoglucanase